MSKAMSPVADREIVLTRVYDAPRELVWEAWTLPEHIARWWGPNGFTTTVDEMAVEPGGLWRFTMHGPDGVDYKNKVVYVEVVRRERLVYSHGGEEDIPRPFHVTVTFEEAGGKTRVEMRSVLASVEEYERVKAFGAVELGQQTFARLAEYLREM